MAGGIEQQIQQRMDAYRGNPQRLMQKYQQSQELLDLLALQKLKSEKEAAARQMQMQMQQSPQTVKQQREAELMQLTKNELAADVGKTLAQQQAKSQNNLQRVANQGIATAPAQNMARMARGGIVGYARGDLVDAEDAAISGDPRKRYQELKSRRRGFLSPSEIDELARLEERFGGEGPKGIPQQIDEAIGKLLETPTEPRPADEIPMLGQGTASGTIEEMNAQKPAGIAAVAPQRPSVPTEDETDYLEGGPRTATGQTEGEQRLEERVGTEAPASPFANLQTRGVKIPESKVGSLDAEKYQVQYDDAGLESLQKQFAGMAGIDKDKAREAGYTSAMGKIDYTPEERKGLEALIQERKDLETRRMDPAARRREQLSAFFRGAANRSGIGSTLAGASAGAAKARGTQQEAEMALLEGRQKEIKDLIEKSRGIREKGYEYGTKDREEAGRDIRAGLEGQLGISKEQADRAESNANRLLEVDAANLDAETAQRQMELKAAIQIADQEFTRDIKIIEGSLEQQKIDAQEAYNKAMINSNDKRYAENALVNVNKAIGEITGAYDELYNERINNLSLDPRFAGDEAALNAEVNRLESQRDALLATVLKDLQDQQARLDDILTGNSGTGGFTVRKKSP